MTPTQGTVKVGKATNLTFTVDATRLLAGKRNAIVAFNTNDPTAKTLEVPVDVTVTGEPKIELSTASINFGEVWVSQKGERKLVIHNKGTDTLTISALTFGNPLFGASVKNLEIAAKTEEEVVLSASPNDGNFKSTLTISSNDPQQPNVKVSLELKAVAPPSLAINPLDIEFKLEPNQKERNKLRFRIQVRHQAPGKQELLSLTRSVQEVMT